MSRVRTAQHDLRDLVRLRAQNRTAVSPLRSNPSLGATAEGCIGNNCAACLGMRGAALSHFDVRKGCRSKQCLLMSEAGPAHSPPCMCLGHLAHDTEAEQLALTRTCRSNAMVVRTTRSRKITSMFLVRFATWSLRYPRVIARVTAPLLRCCRKCPTCNVPAVPTMRSARSPQHIPTLSGGYAAAHDAAVWGTTQACLGEPAEDAACPARNISPPWGAGPRPNGSHCPCGLLGSLG